MDATARPATLDAGQHAGHSLRHMVDEIDTFLKSAADTGDERFNAVRDRLEVQVREMRRQIDELNDAALAKFRRAAQAADQTVQSHPYGAMGIAAAAGLLIGFLASRR
jgi:ElaB/YqjD/DUF883 family membrane-anchored ribosome-binding protein